MISKAEAGYGINKFVQSIIREKEISIYGDGSQTRDFTFIDDIVSANLISAKSNIAGEVFNIGGGNRISVNNLIRAIEFTTGKKAIIEYSDCQKGDVTDTLADVSKARDMLGWKAMIDITMGLEKYVSWIRNMNEIKRS